MQKDEAAGDFSILLISKGSQTCTGRQAGTIRQTCRFRRLESE